MLYKNSTNKECKILAANFYTDLKKKYNECKKK